MEAGLILLVIIAFFALLLAAKTVRIIPQARAGVVERLGRYQRTLSPGLAIAGELGIPVKLIGIGEALEDLRPFDADDYARALLT